ncbi:MAG TPA: hypothetical protein VGC67_17860 [Cellulomonas sp.]
MARTPRDPAEPRTPLRRRDSFPILVTLALIALVLLGIGAGKLAERHQEHVLDDQAVHLIRALSDGNLSVGNGSVTNGWFTTQLRGYVVSGAIDTPGPEEVTALIERSAAEVDVAALCTTLYGAAAGRFVHDNLAMPYTDDECPTVVCNFFYRDDAAGKIALCTTSKGSAILRFTYGMDHRNGYRVPGIGLRDDQGIDD